MWPQKWNASASPGLTSAATAPPPARRASSREVRARKPRRDVESARLSPMTPASGSRGNNRLELTVGIERAFRPYLSERVYDHRIRAAGNIEAAPDVGVAHLVEDEERNSRIPSERGERRLQSSAHPAAFGREDGERHPRLRAASELDLRSEQRPFSSDVERELRPQPQTQQPDFASQGEHGNRQRHDASERGRECEGEPAPRARRSARQERDGEESRSERNVANQAAEPDPRAHTETAARRATLPAQKRNARREGEHAEQHCTRVRRRGNAGEESGRDRDLERDDGYRRRPPERSRHAVGLERRSALGKGPKLEGGRDEQDGGESDAHDKRQAQHDRNACASPQVLGGD